MKFIKRVYYKYIQFLLFTIIMLNNKNLKLISVIKKYINNDPELYIKDMFIINNH